MSFLFMETYITNSFCKNVLKIKNPSQGCELHFFIFHIIMSIFLLNIIHRKIRR
jgi:hypothetical protein